MPLAKLVKSMQFGTLGSAFTAGAASLVLTAGQGARFDAIGSGEYYYLVIRDLNVSQALVYDSFTVVRATALSTDTFTLDQWTVDGSTSHSFPIAGGGDLASACLVEVANNLAQVRRLVQGAGAIIQATAPTLNSESPETLILTPAAPITQALPTTNVWAGRRFKIYNQGSLGNTITINASGGATVVIIAGGLFTIVTALKDAPTVAADWTTDLIAGSGIGLNTITGANIANNTIVSAKIADNTIDAGAKLLDNSLTSSKVLNNSIDASTKLLDNSITSSKILNNTILASAKLLDASVNQAKMQTALDQQTGTGGFTSLISFAGGAYTLGYGVGNNASAPSGARSGDSLAPVFGSAGYVTAILINQSSSATYWFQARYIQASPPYDLGDGEIPLFVFALLDSKGKIVRLAVAPDPIWANNGPTPINPAHPRVFDAAPLLQTDIVEIERDGETVKVPHTHTIAPGKRYVWMPKFDRKNEKAILAHLKGEKRYSDPDFWEPVEMTQAVKNADMPLIPHPFIGNDLTGLTPVLLDPVNPIMERLLEHHTANEEGARISELLEHGYLLIDNAELSRKGPPGVKVVGVKWKAG